MFRYVMIVSGACILPALVARADVLYDTLWITDDYAGSGANSNALGGRGVFGDLYDLRLADDFEVRSDTYPNGFTIELVTADYLAFMRSTPADGVYVRVYQDASGLPSEPPMYEELATDVTAVHFFELTGLEGRRIAVDGLSMTLEPGHYWINIQPADTTPSGDWYYQVRGAGVVGYDTHVRDGDLGEGGYGHRDWRSTQDDGFGAGTAAMRIEGIPEPASLVLLGVGSLFCRRHA